MTAVTATLAPGGEPVTLTCDRGFLRMVLMCARTDANAMGRAEGAGSAWRGHWSRRSKAISEALAQLPEPENPRDPYEDLPGEPTPAEADAARAVRYAAEDARVAARQAVAVTVDDLLADPEPLCTSREGDVETAFTTAIPTMQLGYEIEDLLA